MTSVSPDLVASDITQRVGDAALYNINPFTFVQSPACGYSVAISLTGLPSFMTANHPSSNDFNVDSIIDSSLMGSYSVTIHAEIQVPDDHTQSTFTTWAAEQTFSVYVQPCQLTSVSAVVFATEVIQSIGESGKTGGAYEFA